REIVVAATPFTTVTAAQKLEVVSSQVQRSSRIPGAILIGRSLNRAYDHDLRALAHILRGDFCLLPPARHAIPIGLLASFTLIFPAKASGYGHAEITHWNALLGVS